MSTQVLHELADAFGAEALDDSQLTGGEANAYFLECHEAPGLYLEGEDGSCLLSRERFLEELAKPFRRDIYLKRSVLELPRHCFTPVLELEGTLSVESAAEAVLSREADYVHEPVVVRGPSNRRTRVLDVRHIFRALLKRLEIENTRVKRLLADVEAANAAVMESIAYASHLQEAMMPSLDSLPCELDCAVAYRPRDQVSGDFYWQTSDERYCVTVVADCTGHGVPGAMISMTAMPILREACLEHGLFAPDALIRELDERLRAALHGERRRDADMAYDDGLEIAIACLDCKTGETRIATAGPPVHHIDAATGQSVRCRTRRYGVGFHQVNDEAITQTRTNLQSGDALLLYTDGLVEQVGGDRGIMLGRKRVIETAQSVHMQPASAVRDRLMEAYDAWRGERAPRDDLTLMVLKYGGRHAS